jgi:hypothetical protein
MFYPRARTDVHFILVLFFSDNVGKEVVSRFQTSLNNKNLFYTDANGREVLQRQ